MDRIINSYVGMQGISAGPIKVGPTGGWIISDSSSGTPTISFKESVAKQGNPKLCKLYAAMPSEKEKDSVVTMRYLIDKGLVQGDGIDPSDYVVQTEFDYLYSVVLGDNKDYNGNPVVIRLDKVEETINSFNHSDEIINNKISELNRKITANSDSIKAIEKQLQDFDTNPFKGPTLLVAGGA